MIKKINFNHSLIFFNICIILSSISYLKDNSLTIFCLFLILTIGISHGALDNIKGKNLLKIFKINSIFVFYIGYILISLLIILIWILFPKSLLLIFLFVASYHFGKEDTQFLISKISYFDQLLFFFKGSLIILAPMFFHFDNTVSIFKLLLVDNEIFYSTLAFIEANKILPILIILSTISGIYLFLNKFEIKKFTIFLDYFSILILNYYLSPLIAFTIYFCFLHSIRHSISLINEIDNKDFANGLKVFTKKALLLIILTAIFCIIALYLLNNNYDFNNSILKIIFIGLASLTFPHILLEYLIEKNEK